MIRQILNWFHPSQKNKRPNVTGVHNAVGWAKAKKAAMVFDRKISRFNEKPKGWFVEWDEKEGVFREGILGKKTRRLYVIDDHPADYVSADWYVFPE